MVRYRKGNKYLSEEENIEDENNAWGFYLFLIGAILSGYLTYSNIMEFDWPKWLNFTLIIVAGFVGGGMLGALHKQIRFLIAFGVAAGIIYFFGALLWDKV